MIGNSGEESPGKALNQGMLAGFDTADLQEAKALLEALEGEHGRG
jgi:hypothetical protein